MPRSPSLFPSLGVSISIFTQCLCAHACVPILVPSPGHHSCVSPASMSPSLVGVPRLAVPIPSRCSCFRWVFLSPVGVPRLDVPIPSRCSCLRWVSLSPSLVGVPGMDVPVPRVSLGRVRRSAPAARGGAVSALGGAAPFWSLLAARSRAGAAARGGPGAAPGACRGWSLVPGSPLSRVVPCSGWSRVVAPRAAAAGAPR